MSLDEADRRVIGEDMATVEFGWPVGMPVCRPLGQIERDRAMKAKAKKKARVGQPFDDFFKQEGIQEEGHAAAIKRVIAWQLVEAMKARHISKSEMARRMSTSRSQLNRLLDPNVEAIELQTLVRAAHVLGRNLRVELV